MDFKKATRSTARARIFIFGPSGLGKSGSALVIAKGITDSYERILQVDTEHGRGEALVHKTIGEERIGDFYCQRLQKPFTVQKYLDILVEAEKSGQFDAIIFDSVTHLWENLLDMKDEVSKTNRNPDARSDWAPVTAEYKEFVEAILQSDLHIIMTCRSRTAWDYKTDEKGKLKPVIIGLGPNMKDGFQYESGIILFMADKGVAVNLKDDTDLLPTEPFIPTVATGKLIQSWYQENEEAAKASGLYGLKAHGYKNCPKCNGLMEVLDTDEVGGILVNIYRCKLNHTHTLREKATA